MATSARRRVQGGMRKAEVPRAPSCAAGKVALKAMEGGGRGDGRDEDGEKVLTPSLLFANCNTVPAVTSNPAIAKTLQTHGSSPRSSPQLIVESEKKSIRSPLRCPRCSLDHRDCLCLLNALKS